MRLLFLLMASAFFAINASFAQGKKTTMQILTSTTWGSGKEVSDFDGNHYYDFCRFDHKNCYSAFVVSDKNSYKATDSRPYYLSDTPDRVFDESKAGKAKNGKYLIMKMSKPGYKELTLAHEFIEVTPDKITWKVHGVTGEGITTITRSPIDPWKGKSKN